MVNLDPARLRYELGRRGLTQAGLAQLSGVSEGVISRAVNGRPVQPRTLQRLTTALDREPVMTGPEIALSPA